MSVAKLNCAKSILYRTCIHSGNRFRVCIPPDFIWLTLHQKRETYPKWFPRVIFSNSAEEIHTSCRFLRACINSSISAEEYENLVADTLVSLAECFEDLPEKINCSKDYDVTYHDGVLTISLGGSLGTYVINKQSPNRQIWLSSPKSGPKRYDYEDGRWIYHRGREGLHSLLEKELSEILQTPINLSSCFCYS